MKDYEHEMLQDAIQLAIVKNRSVIRLKRAIWIMAALSFSLAAALIILLIVR